MNIMEKVLKYFGSKGTLSFYVCTVCLVLLPLNNRYLPPFMVLWGLIWIFENIADFKILWNSRSLSKLLFVSFLIYYLFQLFGLIYSEDIKMGLSNAFGRLSLILFPLVLFEPGEMIKKKVKLLLRIFALSSVTYLVLCFSYAAYRALSFVNGALIFNPHPPEYEWLSYFYGSDLTLFQHPSYFAMYAILSAFIAFESFFDFELGMRKRIVWFTVAVFLLISLFFLSSRASILAALIIIPVYFFIRLNKIKYRNLVFLGIIVGLLISLFLLSKNQRVQYFYDKILQKDTYGESQTEPRIIIWKSAYNIIHENLLIGVGIGDVRNELSKQYTKIGEPDMAAMKLNAHNQFLEILLENGIIGFLLFLSLLGIMVYGAIVGKNLLYGVFIIMMVVFFMFETILYRLGGVSFFSLFSLLLIHLNIRKQTVV